MKHGKIVRKQLYLFTPLQICIVLRGQYHILQLAFPPHQNDLQDFAGFRLMLYRYLGLNISTRPRFWCLNMPQPTCLQASRSSWGARSRCWSMGSWLPFGEGATNLIWMKSAVMHSRRTISFFWQLGIANRDIMASGPGTSSQKQRSRTCAQFAFTQFYPASTGSHQYDGVPAHATSCALKCTSLG